MHLPLVSKLKGLCAIMQRATHSVQQTCQRLEQCWRMTSSWWRVILRTTAGGRQSWVGWTWVQDSTFEMTASPWQPMRRWWPHNWRLQHLQVSTAQRSIAALSLLNRRHLRQPVRPMYPITATRGRRQHSIFTVSTFQYTQLNSV